MLKAIKMEVSEVMALVVCDEGYSLQRPEEFFGLMLGRSRSSWTTTDEDNDWTHGRLAVYGVVESKEYPGHFEMASVANVEPEFYGLYAAANYRDRQQDYNEWMWLDDFSSFDAAVNAACQYRQLWEGANQKQDKNAHGWLYLEPSDQKELKGRLAGKAVFIRPETSMEAAQ